MASAADIAAIDSVAPAPNSATNASATHGEPPSFNVASSRTAAEPAIPCIAPTSSARPEPCACA